MSDRRTPIGLVSATRNTPITGARALVMAGVLGVTPAMAIAQSQDEWMNSLDRIGSEAVTRTDPQANGSQPSQGGKDEPNADSKMTVSEYMTFDIFVRDEDLATVLEMLSANSQKNIVASRDVVATVTANLYSVTFYEALDAILNVNGYGYVEEGNFIYVYPAAEIERIRQEQRQVVSKVIQLNYLNANDAALFVQPLLSEIGDIRTNGDVGDFNLPDDRPTGNEEFAHTSTLVIYDYPEHVEEIAELLGQLDTRPAQVLVESQILQTQLTEDNAFGVDFSFVVDLDLSDFTGIGGPLSVVKNLVPTGDTEVFPDNGRGGGGVSTPGNISGPGTFKAGLIYDDFSVFVRALDEVTDVQVLSNPKILALNRQPARVLVGRKLGYLNTTTTETATTQTVQFLDTGTQLAFRPFISNDGMIRMELRPRVSEGFIRDATDATGAGVTIPDEVTQEITTNVIVPDGATIVLGGLFRESTNLSRRQVPVVGDIPIIGAAFRGYDDEIDRSEIIFMIKPTVMNDRIMIEQGDRANEFVDYLRAGSREGLLPWSRTRQTGQLNMRAERLAAEGKMNEAAWALRRSLELDPEQPTALELRERLFDQKVVWPTRSLLDRVIDGEVESVPPMDWPKYNKQGERVSDAEQDAPTPIAENTPTQPETHSGWTTRSNRTLSSIREFHVEHGDSNEVAANEPQSVNGETEPLTDAELAEFEQSMMSEFVVPESYETQPTATPSGIREITPGQTQNPVETSEFVNEELTLTPEATTTELTLPEAPVDGSPIREIPVDGSVGQTEQNQTFYGPMDPMEFEWALRQMNTMFGLVGIEVPTKGNFDQSDSSRIADVDQDIDE